MKRAELLGFDTPGTRLVGTKLHHPEARVVRRCRSRSSVAMSIAVQAIASAPSRTAWSAASVMQWAVNSGWWFTAGSESMPIMGCAMGLFFLAAMIEGFLSPSAAPYAVKAGVAVISSGLLMFYFVVLGYPRSASRAV